LPKGKKSKPSIGTYADRGSYQWRAICAARDYFVGICLRAGFFFLSFGDVAVNPPLDDAISLARNEFPDMCQDNHGIRTVVGFKYSH